MLTKLQEQLKLMVIVTYDHYTESAHMHTHTHTCTFGVTSSSPACLSESIHSNQVILHAFANPRIYPRELNVAIEACIVLHTCRQTDRHTHAPSQLYRNPRAATSLENYISKPKPCIYSINGWTMVTNTHHLHAWF